MQLLELKRLYGTITLKSGMRIGMSKEQMAIGDVDNPVIRNPLTEEPYIPGSSLKGKMRYLLEWSLGGKYIEGGDGQHVYASPEPTDPIARIFGIAPGGSKDKRALERGPTRILVRDAYLTEKSRDELRKMPMRGGYMTEIKQEVFIPRIGGDANPRVMERVPAGAVFDFELIYRVFDLNDGGQLDQENFKLVERALQLVQLDGLGGSISRGYGQLAIDYQVEPHAFFGSRA
jgi:CRISPR-associated protein Csm3